MKFIAKATIVLMTTIGVFLLSQGSAVAIEKPDYTIERTDGKFEIRAYPLMLLAEVDVTGDRNTAANRGFRKLAGFIFGDNVTPEGSSKISMTSPVVQSPQSEKISMTSPVIQRPQSEGESQTIDMTSSVVQKPITNGPNFEGKWTVNFMMPSEYSMQTLPKPIDNDIRIFESKPYRSVSIRFSGRSTKSNIAKHEKRLMVWVTDQSLEIDGNPEYAFYDAPFIPPMFRRNEVHFRLAD